MTPVRKGVEDYLAMRRAMGFKLVDVANTLREFASYLARQGTFHITSERIIQWAKRRPGAHPGRWTRRFRNVRRFAEYWAAIDPRTEVPPLDMMSYRYRRRLPYWFRDRDIRSVMRAAERSALPCGFTYSTLVGLLATTGLRRGEAVALDQADVDLSAGVITIRKTKFGKSRLVPLHLTTRKALAHYARWRDRRYPGARGTAFFVSSRGRRLHPSTSLSAFTRLCKQAGLGGDPLRAPPSLHALRHRFAVTTLLRWYRAGLDVGCRIPSLSTYLGHTCVSNTYWYLSAEPRLMRLAGARLEKTLGGLP